MFYTIDPTQHFMPKVDKQQLIAACGLLPYFFQECEERAAESQEEIVDSLQKSYGFPVVEMEGGKVDAEGVYRYPEDPPLYPLLSCTYADWDSEVEFLVYQHAIVAIRTKDGIFVTRMD